MTKEEKYNLIEELDQRLKDNQVFYLTDSSGLTVAEINAFRQICFDKGVEFKMYKNTLIKKALDKQEGDFDQLSELLKGTTGIMFSPEVAKLPAEVIKEFKKTQGSEKPSLKAASINSDLFIGAENLNTLSELKSKDELIGDILGLLQSPAKNVISALQSSGQTISGLLKTLEEKQ